MEMTQAIGRPLVIEKDVIEHDVHDHRAEQREPERDEAPADEQEQTADDLEQLR